MAIFFKAVLVAIVGVALGLLATWLSIDEGRGFGAVRAGPWIGWPRAGTAAADPYAKAAMSRTGEIPLGLAEGLSFIARTDSQNRPLQKNCTYTIKPPVPVARYWAISLATPEGQVTNNDFGRTGLTSSEIVRTGSNQFSITISTDVQSGNWLPINGKNDFVLVLRLYDTPVSAAASTLRAADMPGIFRGTCS